MTEPADWPTIEEVKRQLRISDSDRLDDDLLEECRDAARDYVIDRTDREEYRAAGPDEIPPRLRRAAIMLAARLFKRRDSLDGSVGMPDVGIVQVVGRDWDIERLIFPFVRIPVA